jgi:LacI family transcriptional regulator
MKIQKVKIYDIAIETGSSISTVSRVLSGKAEQYRISKKSEQTILEVAKRLNYVPNQFASNLRTGKSNTIALVIPSLNNPFFAAVASTINTEVRKFGYITIISDSDENQEVEKVELQQLMSRNIEGLIIIPCGNQSEYIKQIYDQGIPLICIDRYFEEMELPFVSTDNYVGAFTATKYLIDNGHSIIACIQGVQQSTPNKLRVKGFLDAVRKVGIETYSITGDEFSMQNGYLETKLLLRQKNRPTAIFAFNNSIAMGCLKALKEENVNIPNNISLITFDDHPYLDFLATPLTCISQPVSDICKSATKYLFARLNNKDLKATQLLLKPTLIIKDSVRRL